MPRLSFNSCGSRRSLGEPAGSLRPERLVRFASYDEAHVAGVDSHRLDVVELTCGRIPSVEAGAPGDHFGRQKQERTRDAAEDSTWLSPRQNSPRTNSFF